MLSDLWEVITDLSYTELKGIYSDLFIRTSEHALPIGSGNQPEALK